MAILQNWKTIKRNFKSNSQRSPATGPKNQNVAQIFTRKTKETALDDRVLGSAMHLSLYRQPFDTGVWTHFLAFRSSPWKTTLKGRSPLLSNADKKWMNDTTSGESASDLKRPTTAYWSINYVGSSASAVAPTASSVNFVKIVLQPVIKKNNLFL